MFCGPFKVHPISVWVVSVHQNPCVQSTARHLLAKHLGDSWSCVSYSRMAVPVGFTAFPVGGFVLLWQYRVQDTLRK